MQRATLLLGRGRPKTMMNPKATNAVIEAYLLTRKIQQLDEQGASIRFIIPHQLKAHPHNPAWTDVSWYNIIYHEKVKDEG